MKSSLFAACLLLAATSSGAFAEPIQSYVARLSAADHFKSSGEHLDSAAAIVRQDRLNLYVFGKGDSEDEWEPFFAEKGNRERLEDMFNRGATSDSVKKAILNGKPLVRVDVYPGYITVDLYRK